MDSSPNKENIAQTSNKKTKIIKSNNKNEIIEN